MTEEEQRKEEQLVCRHQHCEQDTDVERFSYSNRKNLNKHEKNSKDHGQCSVESGCAACSMWKDKRYSSASKTSEDKRLKYLPSELISLILHQGDDTDFLIHRFVCRKWKVLLDDTQAEFKESDKYFFTNRLAKKGHVALFIWAGSKGAPIHPHKAFVMAAKSGNLTLLQWMKEKGCSWNMFAATGAAAKRGHLEALKWLVANGCDMNCNTFAQAAEGGHFEVLRWLLAQGCPFNSTACYCAASKGKLEVLKWLRGAGCPWDSNSLKAAEAGGHFDVLIWGSEQGCPPPKGY